MDLEEVGSSLGRKSQMLKSDLGYVIWKRSQCCFLSLM
jgi:hypothetical protein